MVVILLWIAATIGSGVVGWLWWTEPYQVVKGRHVADSQVTNGALLRSQWRKAK